MKQLKNRIFFKMLAVMGITLGAGLIMFPLLLPTENYFRMMLQLVPMALIVAILLIFPLHLLSMRLAKQVQYEKRQAAFSVDPNPPTIIDIPTEIPEPIKPAKPAKPAKPSRPARAPRVPKAAAQAAQPGQNPKADAKAENTAKPAADASAHQEHTDSEAPKPARTRTHTTEGTAAAQPRKPRRKSAGSRQQAVPDETALPQPELSSEAESAEIQETLPVP